MYAVASVTSITYVLIQSWRYNVNTLRFMEIDMHPMLHMHGVDDTLFVRPHPCRGGANSPKASPRATGTRYIVYL